MKLDKSIVVVGDLGRLKAYRVIKEDAIKTDETAKVDHIEQHYETEIKRYVLNLFLDIDFIQPRKKEVQLESDEMGRFGGKFGTSTGQENDMFQEEKKGTLKSIAKMIDLVVKRESPKSWYLAFSKGTHKKLKGFLKSKTKKRLKKVLPEDLTKINKDKILSYFQ
jgi:hypothetical protein